MHRNEGADAFAEGMEGWSQSGARALHWFSDARERCWLSQSGPRENKWHGWSAQGAQPVVRETDEAWPVCRAPWSATKDATEAPFVRWYVDGRTSAAFNEVDRHVLTAQDDCRAPAFYLEPDPQSGRTSASHMTLSDLLHHSTLATSVLREDLGVASGGRVGIYLPNGPWAMVWIEASKRGAWPFCSVAAGTVANALIDRMEDTAVSAFIAGGDEASAAVALEVAEACANLDLRVVLVRGDWTSNLTTPDESDANSAPVPSLVAARALSDAHKLLHLAARRFGAQRSPPKAAEPRVAKLADVASHKADRTSEAGATVICSPGDSSSTKTPSDDETPSSQQGNSSDLPPSSSSEYASSENDYTSSDHLEELLAYGSHTEVQKCVSQLWDFSPLVAVESSHPLFILCARTGPKTDPLSSPPLPARHSTHQAVLVMAGTPRGRQASQRASSMRTVAISPGSSRLARCAHARAHV